MNGWGHHVLQLPISDFSRQDIVWSGTAGMLWSGWGGSDGVSNNNDLTYLVCAHDIRILLYQKWYDFKVLLFTGIKKRCPSTLSKQNTVRVNRPNWTRTRTVYQQIANLQTSTGNSIYPSLTDSSHIERPTLSPWSMSAFFSRRYDTTSFRPNFAATASGAVPN
jgi:hypothetical protein